MLKKMRKFKGLWLLLCLAAAVSSVTSELDVFSDEAYQYSERRYPQAPSDKPKKLIDADQLNEEEAAEDEENAEETLPSY